MLFRSQLRNRTVARVKVQWKHFTAEEATWEREDEMMEKYPSLFEKLTLVVSYQHRGRCLFSEGEYVTPLVYVSFKLDI